MGSYYNKTRGTLTLALQDGSPLAIPAKKWVKVPSHLENSSSITVAMKKGFLAKSKIPDEVIEVPIEMPSPPAATSLVMPQEQKIEVVAESTPLVQNQPPKPSFQSKSVKTSKPDSEEPVSEEPRRKKE